MLNISFWNIAFTIINLLVLYLFMKHFLVKPVSAMLDERKQMVETDLDNASASKAEAARMKQEYEASLGNAEEEASRIVAEAREKAHAEYDKILDQARADASRKLEDADKTIALEQEKALSDLRGSVASLAMTAAAKLLAEQSNPEHDKKLYQGFLEKSGEGND